MEGYMNLYNEIRNELLKLYTSVGLLEKFVDLTISVNSRRHKKSKKSFHAGKLHNCKKTSNKSHK
jgi:hypothetical protein